MELTELKQFLKRVEFLKGVLPEPNFIFSVKNELHNIFGNQIRIEIISNHIYIKFHKFVEGAYISPAPTITLKGINIADMYIPFIKRIINYEESLQCQA